QQLQQQQQQLQQQQQQLQQQQQQQQPHSHHSFSRTTAFDDVSRSFHPSDSALPTPHSGGASTAARPAPQHELPALSSSMPFPLYVFRGSNAGTGFPASGLASSWAALSSSSWSSPSAASSSSSSSSSSSLSSASASASASASTLLFSPVASALPCSSSSSSS